MPVETSATISELNPLFPLNSDSRAQCAPHLRNLKTAIQAGVREKLTATYDLYVRTDGSDSNTGLANTSGAAFLTIQAAVNKLSTLDCNSKTVNINVADGTYTGTIVVDGRKLVGCGSLSILGNTGTPANVFLNVTGTCVKASGDVYVLVSGVKTQATGHGFEAQFGARIEVGKVTHGACALSHMFANFGGVILTSDAQAITGGGGNHMLAYRGGKITHSAFGATTTTLSGTPAFTTAFATAQGADSQISNGGTTWSGSATGQRYSATLTGVIDTGGAGSTYYPGNSVVAASSGAQYA